MRTDVFTDEYFHVALKVLEGAIEHHVEEICSLGNADEKLIMYHAGCIKLFADAEAELSNIAEQYDIHPSN